MSNKKAFILSDGAIKTFNSNNIWVTTSLSYDSLTVDDFTNQGFDPDILSTSLTNMYVNFIDNGELGDDGQHLWISQDIDKNLGVTAMEYVDDDVTPKINLTIPAFIPKDQLKSTDKLLIYTDDTTYQPTIVNTSFSATSTHNQVITLTVTPEYIYNKKVIYRTSVNNNISSWSSPQSSIDTFDLSILPSNLVIGKNTISIDIADADDNTKTSTTTLENAITLTNSVPTINIISAESDNFQIHFIITDADAGDLGTYQLTLSNSKGNKLLVPYGDLQNMPIDIKYQFDSSDIVVNDTNILKIEFKDNLNSSSSTNYTFTGEYKNILFCDENGEYYTTDKGALLKLLDLGKIIGGRASEIKTISLQNNNTYDINNITITKTDNSNIPGTYVEFSKTSNPFNAMNDLDFGDQTLKYKDKLDFYVRLRTDDTAMGIDQFYINVFAMNTDQQ